MGKRKADAKSTDPTASKMDVDGDDSGEEEEDFDMLDIDLEWFDMNPSIDFHGLKALLKQLFDVDNELLELSELTDLILNEPYLGNVVKCEGEEGDPYAFLTVLSLRQHAQKAVMKQLDDWLAQEVAGIGGLKQFYKSLATSQDANVGLLLNERVINMPHQVVPPLYQMLEDELEYAVTDGEKGKPYAFTHYLLVSKAYTEVASAVPQADRPAKKVEGTSKAASGETLYAHPEDEVLLKHALYHGNFEYTRQGERSSDSRRAFEESGIKPQGLVMLIEASKLKVAVKAVAEYLEGQA